MTLTMQNLDRLIVKNCVTHESDLEQQRFSASFRSGEEELTNVDISVDGSDICFTSYLSKALSGEEMGKAAEFVTRANQNFTMGSLQLDYDSGSVYFKVLCHINENQELSPEELAPYLFIGPMTAQLYGKNGLEKVLKEGLSPQEALEKLSQLEEKPAMSFVLPDPPAGLKPAKKKRPETRKDTTPIPAFDDEDEEDFRSDRYDFDDFDHGLLTESVRDYYDSQNWHYDYDPVNNVLRMSFHSKCADNYHIITFIRDEERFTTLTVFPIKIPEDKRAIVEEYIARANYGMILGCFEMDPRDGQLQFKNTCMCGEIQLDQEILENHIDIGFRMCDRYGPGLMEILYGNATAKEAIERVESDIRPVNSPAPPAPAPQAEAAETAEETAPSETPPAPADPPKSPSRKKGLKRLWDALFGGDEGAK
jgi:hypothetical protein